MSEPVSETHGETADGAQLSDLLRSVRALCPSHPDSPEAVALELTLWIFRIERIVIRYDGKGATIDGRPARDYMLATYAEILRTVQGERAPFSNGGRH